MKTPKTIESYHLLFCDSISKSKPFFVPYRPLRNKPINQCFDIVPEHIRVNRGKQHIGWSIWEWPAVMLEAEFHCIWEDKIGRLFDISPKYINTFDRILFLPDPEAQVTSSIIENRTIALSDDIEVKRYMEILGVMCRIEINNVNMGLNNSESINGIILNLGKEMEKLKANIINKFGSPIN